MIKKIISIFSVIMLFLIFLTPVNAATENLHAKYIAVIDGDSNRLLFGKNENQTAPNASTTKIATCITALDICSKNIVCTVSPYAASMPDVQLNASKSDQFYIDDLYYSMMLKSHNDSAEIIAENIALYYIYSNGIDNIPFLDYLTKNYDYTISDFQEFSEIRDNTSFDSSILFNSPEKSSKFLTACFESLVNYKFNTMGINDINFVTPNGLDGENFSGPHSISAYSLARIMSYCIKNQKFLNITETKNHTFENVSGSKSYSVSNANAFLDMYENIISGKTGFTGDAGYCYVCAYKDESRIFIVVLLACGWPSNKTYKWSDTRLLLNQCRKAYRYEEIIGDSFFLKPIHVTNGMSDFVNVEKCENYRLLVSDEDKINVLINVPPFIDSPCIKGTQIGTIDIYVNDLLAKEIPLIISSSISRKDFAYYINKIIISYF